MNWTVRGRCGRWSSAANAVGPCWCSRIPGGEPLERLLGAPMEVGRFLRLAIGIVAALGKVHQRGLVHKDIKPANILVNRATGAVRLTGSASPHACRASGRRPSRPS